MWPTHRDRGQLILVGGVALALVFIALGVLLNSAAFTGAEAARDGASDANDALSVRDDAVEGLTGALFYANYYDYDHGHDGLRDALRGDAGVWDTAVSNASAAHRTISGAEVVNITNGTQIYQDEPGNFTKADNTTGDWTLAEDVTGTRRFAVNVSASNLHDGASSSNAFHIRFVTASGTDARVVEFYEPGNGTVSFNWEYGGETGSCDTGQSQVLIELTEGNVSGSACSLDPLTSPDEPYSIKYDNPDRISGNYSLVVDNASVAEGPYNLVGTAPPHQVPAIYNATVEVDHHTATLDYVANATVAPGRTVFGVAPLEVRDLVYATPAGELRSIAPNGSVTRYDASGVHAVGPKQVDFDDDGLLEIPYVNASGDLAVIDSANNTQTVVTGGVRNDKTLLGVGTWRGATSIFYANADDNNNIYRVNWSGGTPDAPSAVTIDGGATQSYAIAGVSDYNNDGDTDLVYVGTSYSVHYADDGTEISVGRTVGDNNGAGIGAPRNFDRRGAPRLPFVDGSGGVAVLDSENQKTRVTDNDPAAKSPVAGIDWRPGGSLGVVFLDSGTSELYYAQVADDGVTHITNQDGNYVEANETVGVA